MNPAIVQAWLNKNHGGNRDWLATQCEAKRSTVNSWFSNRPIPRHAETIIQRLMDADADASQNLVLEVSNEQFDAYNAAAMKRGMLLKQWVIEAANEAAKADAEADDHDENDDEEQDRNTSKHRHESGGDNQQTA